MINIEDQNDVVSTKNIVAEKSNEIYRKNFFIGLKVKNSLRYEYQWKELTSRVEPKTPSLFLKVRFLNRRP